MKIFNEWFFYLGKSFLFNARKLLFIFKWSSINFWSTWWPWAARVIFLFDIIFRWWLFFFNAICSWFCLWMFVKLLLFLPDGWLWEETCWDWCEVCFIEIDFSCCYTPCCVNWSFEILIFLMHMAWWHFRLNLQQLLFSFFQRDTRIRSPLF